VSDIVQPVAVADTSRAYQRYVPGNEPYGNLDQLSQKPWSVVHREFGPEVADVLTRKLEQAVVDHITKGGQRQ
jgi:hypothetical protein